MTQHQSGQPEGKPKRCGFVAIIGAPNAGKSTLVNALTGAKITIVSRKVQTTRVPVRGIAIHGQSQLIFVDTPGIFVPRRRLDRAMVQAAWSGAADADIVCLLVDALKGIDDEVLAILDKLADVNIPCLALINKVDKIADKPRLLELVAELNARAKFGQIFMVSALTGDGLTDFKAHLAQAVAQGPWLFPEDDISDVPMRMLAAEITRERIYDRLHQELPYSLTVETTDWKDVRKGAARIEQTIFVERDGQKKIVLGKGGQTIKQISSEARAEISRLLDRPVHLFLFVKVRENWGADPHRYSAMGLEFPKE